MYITKFDCMYTHTHTLSLSLSLSQGLADESEFIRDTSLQAGQTLVSRYGDKAVELFLPQLERGLFDANWRIRYAQMYTYVERERAYVCEL